MNYIEQLLNDFEDDFGPSATVQESRPMFNDGGMLVQPNADGSRPGYNGEGGAALRLKNLEKDISKYTKEALDEGAKAVLESGSKSLDMRQTIEKLIEEGADTYAELPSSLKTKVKKQIDKYGEVTDEASARLLGRGKKTKTDREKLPDRGAKVVKGSYIRDYTNQELRNLTEEGLYDPNVKDNDGFKKGVPKKKKVTDRIVDIQFSDPKIKEEFIEDFKKRFKGTRMTSGKRGVDNKNLFTKYLSNLKPKTAELALAGLQASLSDQYGDEYRYKADKASLAKETKTSDAYLERISNDPQNLKVKARNIANLSTPEGKGLGILQHMYPKRMGDALNKLALDTTDLTTYGKAEFVLQNLDSEKQKLLEDPVKNKRRIDEIQAIENRLVKGKNVPEVTTTSKRVNQYEPKPKTEYNVKFRRPGQRGLYGYEKIDTNNFVSKLKGADTSRSVAGTADDVLSKIDFKNVDSKNAQQIIIKIADTLEKGGLKKIPPKQQQLIKDQFCTNRKGGQPGSCPIGEAMYNMIKQTNAVKQGAVKSAEATRIAEKASKVARFGTGKGLGAVLGPLGLAGEAVFEVAMAVPGYARGESGKRLLGDSILGLIPGVGQSAEEEFDEYATKDGMSQLEQQKIKDTNRFLELNDALSTASNVGVLEGRGAGRGGEHQALKLFEKQYNEYEPLYNQFVGGPPSESASTALAEQQRINDLINADKAIRAEQRDIAMDEDFMAAGGGIAKEAGDRSGAMTRSMNPDSQGLSYLFNRVKKI